MTGIALPQLCECRYGLYSMGVREKVFVHACACVCLHCV